MGGCTTFIAGDGCILSRTVDTGANLFYGEQRSRERRKDMLRQELSRVADNLARLNTAAANKGSVFVCDHQCICL